MMFRLTLHLVRQPGLTRRALNQKVGGREAALKLLLLIIIILILSLESLFFFLNFFSIQPYYERCIEYIYMNICICVCVDKYIYINR